MAKNDEIEEKEINRRVSAIVKMRCAAAVSMGTTFLGVMGILASKYNAALEAGFRAFIKVFLAGDK